MNREEAIKALNEYGTLFPSDKIEALSMAIEALQAEPCEDVISRQEAVKVEERPKGEWVYHRNELSCVRWSKWECSACHKRQEYKSNFCPNCGSDNRERSEE